MRNKILGLKSLIRETIREQGWVPGRWYPGEGNPVDPDQIDLMGTGGLGFYQEDESIDDENLVETTDIKRLRKLVRSVVLEAKKKRGLWDNIWAKRRRGERPARPGEKGYPKTLDVGKD